LFYLYTSNYQNLLKMKKNFLITAVLIILFGSKVMSQCPETFHDFSALDIYGNELQMSSFAGKKVLVVNTASFCGYTHQYASLQSLYETYGGSDKPYNFEIIGFPANNFMNQEPHDEDSIIGVCDSYGVTFTMMSKISVKGADMHEIYQWLTLLGRNCVQNAAVTWNFQKFMVNPDGSWHGTATPATSPSHSSIVNWITSLAGTEEIIANPTLDVVASQHNKNIIINVNWPNAENISIKLYSITGRHIADIYEGRGSETLNLTYQSGHLTKGIYFIEAGSSNSKVHKKLLVL